MPLWNRLQCISNVVHQLNSYAHGFKHLAKLQCVVIQRYINWYEKWNSFSDNIAQMLEYNNIITAFIVMGMVIWQAKR